MIIYLKSGAEDLFSDALSAVSSFLRSIYKLTMPLWKYLSSKINKFDGSFDEGCQNTSVSAE